MNCSQCNHQDRPGAKFCSECGAKLEQVCPACGVPLLETAKFCNHCGTRLTPAEGHEGTTRNSSAQDSQEASRSDGERRQLTVMFCDLVGSTRLSERLDPEDLQAVLDEYRSVCETAIRRFEGNMAQFFGDGLLVYFGYPRAHEDDSQRAARAGLGMIKTITDLNTKLQRELGIELAVRIGIHTGFVVVGGTGKERKAVGDTLNIAARLQTIANPGTVVITEATYRLLHGFFDCKSLGDQALKGLSQPIAAYEVRHENTARSRLEFPSNMDLAPLVGRKAEMDLLIDRWTQVKEGIGHLVLLSGEAGIGKSRLLESFKQHISKNPQSWLTSCQCSPYYQNTPFYPIIDLLERVVLNFGKEDSQAERLDKLEGSIVQYGLPAAETVPLFASLMSLSLPERFVPLNLTPQAQKQKTIHALNTILLKRAAKQPLLFVMEDLHWVDPSTMELLNLLVDHEPATKILMVFTYRPEFKPPWVGRSYVSQLTLNRLTKNQVVEIVTHIARGKTLPAEVIQQIVSKTDGVPLFVEELTKMVLDSGLLREEKHSYRLMEPLPPLAIPATLQDSLRARLDGLSTVREIVQLAATLGHEFTYELLKSVSSVAEEVLLRELSRLVEAEFLYQEGTPPEATFIFKHTLIRDAAYQSLLKSSRQQLHAKIGDAIEERFPQIIEGQPELLAYHFTEALQARKAVKYWERAGRRTLERCAYTEAVAHLKKGIEVLDAMPSTGEQTQQKLGLQVALGNALLAIKGYAAPEVEQTYAQAHELCQRAGLPAQVFPVLYGLWVVYLMRAELTKTRDTGFEFLELSGKQEDSAPILMGHRLLQFSLLWLGEISGSQTHFEQCINLYDPERHRSLAFQYGQDPAMATLSLASWSLWLLGYPDQALKRSQESLLAAKKTSHSLSLAFAHIMAAGFHQLRREGRLVQEKAESAIAICEQHGFPYFMAWGNILKGWASAQRGETNDGIAQIRRGMADYRETGSMLNWPRFCALLAEAHAKAGQTKEGLSALDEGLAVLERTGERYYEAELRRLKGEMLLRSKNCLPETGILTEVQKCFDTALKIARRQSAKSLELRASMSLSRLAKRQGKKEQTPCALKETHLWFQEGFNTPDFQEARALIAEIES